MGICLMHNTATATESKTTKIYGIKRTYGQEATAWERTDDAVGLTATASLGSTAGQSDFDNIAPWSGMQRTTIINAVTRASDVLVTIPKFYYERKVENGIESIRITSTEGVEGFELHPAFLADGVEYDEVLISAYEGSANNQSVAGQTPAHNTRAVFRTIAQTQSKVDDGYGMMDIACWSMLQMLYLVEYADYDSNSKIGISVERKGSTSGSTQGDGKINTGLGDVINGHTGRATTDTTPRYNAIRYRWIENPFGNTYTWVDGINSINGETYICTNPSKYSDTNEDYTKLGYTMPYNTNGYLVKTIGYDPAMPWVMLPNEYAGITFDSHNTTGAFQKYVGDKLYMANSTTVQAHCFGGSCLEQGFGANGFHNVGTAAPSLIRLDICSRMVYRRKTNG